MMGTEFGVTTKAYLVLFIKLIILLCRQKYMKYAAMYWFRRIFTL